MQRDLSLLASLKTAYGYVLIKFHQGLEKYLIDLGSFISENACNRFLYQLLKDASGHFSQWKEVILGRVFFKLVHKSSGVRDKQQGSQVCRWFQFI